jgi:glycerol-3-phosphate dehydrogenase
MNRQEMLSSLEKQTEWDILIVGGGATGLGAAVDSASRGFKTLLVEQSDFAKGTSSKSTKLIHGGVRYLQQGNMALVTEALHERGTLCQNAPHLVHHLPFLVPNYKWWEGPFYGVGFKIYDLLAGDLGIEKSKHLTRKQTLLSIPTLEKKDLRGGTIYYDGQFDDARLAISLAQTAHDNGAVLLNYMRATSLIKKKGSICGIKATDTETGKHFALRAKVVINATGVFSDHLCRLDNQRVKPIISPSQGVHLVLPKSFMPTKSALLVPHTEDGRVIFLVPWHNCVILGTTDTAISKPTLEPKAHKKEIDFLLKYAAQYLSRAPTKKDILSVFAGLRPLVKSGKEGNTAALSRDHTIIVSSSGLITITGGKWTTYRKMAEDVINKAILMGDLPNRPCETKKLPLHGYQKNIDPTAHFSTYGTHAKEIKALMRKRASLRKKIHPQLPYYRAEVVWAVRAEMARTLEDVLARRTRSLLLNAKASLEAAPLVAHLMAKELKKSSSWEKKEVAAYTKLAKNYRVDI